MGPFLLADDLIVDKDETSLLGDKACRCRIRLVDAFPFLSLLGRSLCRRILRVVNWYSNVKEVIFLSFKELSIETNAFNTSASIIIVVIICCVNFNIYLVFTSGNVTLIFETITYRKIAHVVFIRIKI